MNGSKSLKDEILNSIDENLIADNLSEIKTIYFRNQATKQKTKNGFKWGVLGTSLAAAITCAVVLPIALNQPSESNPTSNNEVPQAVSKQSKDISFGVSSIAEVLSSEFQEAEATQKAKLMRGPGAPDDDFWGREGEEDDTNYLTSVEAMYSLASPYLPTVNKLLNNAEFPYEIEENDSEDYPFKIGNFIFNVVENKEEEGEVENTESDETTTEEEVDINDPEISNQDDERLNDGEPDEQEHEEDEDDHPNFSFIEEFYEITGQLITDDVIYPVTGQQITFACNSKHDDAQYSELYLNAQKDDTHEVTIFKSTYSSSFSNSFKEATLNEEYSYESYAYIETELNTVTHNEKEYVERKIINAVEIQSESISNSVNDVIKTDDSEVYLSLKSSYEDEDGVENTIDADMSFRLPNETKDNHSEHMFGFMDIENETTEEAEANNKAFRVDYECKVIKNTPFEMDEEYGHGQHRDGTNKMPMRMMDPHENYTVVFGSFYVYQDEEGNLIDPDFTTEGRHQVVGSGGYNREWYDNWDW